MKISGGRFVITGGVSLIGSHITEARLLGWKPEVSLEEDIRCLVTWREQRDTAKRND